MDNQDIANGASYNDSDKEAYADNLDKYTNLALDINGYDDGMATTNSHVVNNSEAVAGRNKEFNSLDQTKGDYYLKDCEMRIVKGCLDGALCTSADEKSAMVERAEVWSELHDDELKQACQNDPTGNACRTNVTNATQYIAMKDAWGIMRNDVSRSSKNTFDYIYNSDGASERFAEYYNTIDNRTDFFGASNQYEQNLGLGAKWHGGAEFVSRAPLTGLGADGHGSWLTFGAGGILTGTEVYDWRDDAGNTLINAGFDNFKNLYNQTVSDPVAWDIDQLKGEQQALQPIHEKYLGDRNLFNKVSELITNTDMPYGVGNIPLTTEAQGQSGGINLLDYESRVKFGCKLMEYSESQGCNP